MRLPPAKSALGAIATTLAILVAGCGEEPALIPSDDAAAMQDLLERAQEEFDEGSCEELDGTLGKLDRAADRLPDAEVSQQIRTRLNAEIADLNGLAEQCRPAVETVPEPAPVPAPPPAPTTVPPPAPVPVEPTTTEETQPTTETEETTQEDSSSGRESSGPSKNNSSGGKPAKPPRDPCAGSNSPRC